ncbi:hypothetical protein M3P05_19705 [Sansalvadorimonas sp. 2012CJ34-2]|uniref:Phage protein n=1 Tax=Parendozoicomonas callyspongiae TaxID=2942213 RepID=A0ABT0PL81_9GAMM|nr:hypothetical protein [Sansalvadorimonas sp. 2012CJ34-2]MCL6272150.1 hypothetical protein [Sansalvadorimonas sp. 2012CJ34-2]
MTQYSDLIAKIQSGKFEKKELEKLLKNALAKNASDVEMAVREALASLKPAAKVKSNILNKGELCEVMGLTYWGWDTNKFAWGADTEKGELVSFQFANEASLLADGTREMTLWNEATFNIEDSSTRKRNAKEALGKYLEAKAGKTMYVVFNNNDWQRGGTSWGVDLNNDCVWVATKITDNNGVLTMKMEKFCRVCEFKSE